MATSQISSMILLFRYMKPFYNKLAVNIGFSIGNKVLDLMPPLLVAWVIDSVSGNAPLWIQQLVGTDNPWHLALFLSFLAVLIFGLESIFQWAYQLGFQTMAQELQHKLRIDTYEQLQKRETAFFEDHRLGNTMAIVNDDVNQLERFLNTAFNELVQLGVTVVFASAIMMATSLPLAMFSVVPIPIVVLGSLYYQQKISPKYAAIRDRVGAINSRLENNISGMAVIKSFTAEAFELQRVKEESEAYLQANLAAIKWNTLYVPVIRMAIAFGFAGVLLLGSYWILNGADFLSIGQLVLFSMMIQRLLWPLTRLGAMIDDFERAKASANRVFNLLHTESTIQDSEKPEVIDRLSGDIIFEDVCFSYNHSTPVLKDISFHIKPGETVGIAGKTGSGKTSLVKCLLRLYECQSGRISFDDFSIKDIALNSLRRNISLVSQDIYLFHGTVFDNIAYGIDNASKDSVVEAAKLAELHEFIQSSPNGYDSIVGEKGIKLSGGQRQRLSIARAILKNAPIMIFDEATSSVDTETERAIQANIQLLTAGKTALVIAHRLSTIKKADRILVLEEGLIIEDGTHDLLLKTGGVYADLWAIQVGEG